MCGGEASINLIMQVYEYDYYVHIDNNIHALASECFVKSKLIPFSLMDILVCDFKLPKN